MVFSGATGREEIHPDRRDQTHKTNIRGAEKMKPNNHAADKQTKEEEQDDEKEYQAERNRVISLTMRHRCAYCAVDLEETVLISPTQRIIAGIIDEYEAAKEATRDHPDQRVFFVSCPNCKTALSLALAQKKTSEVRR